MMLKLQYFVFSALLSKQTTGGKFDVRKLASGKREKKKVENPYLGGNTDHQGVCAI